MMTTARWSEAPVVAPAGTVGVSNLYAWVCDRLHIYPRLSPAADALVRLLEAGLRDKHDINQALGALGYSVPNLDLLLQGLSTPGIALVLED